MTNGHLKNPSVTFHHGGMKDPKLLAGHFFTALYNFRIFWTLQKTCGQDIFKNPRSCWIVLERQTYLLKMVNGSVGKSWARDSPLLLCPRADATTFRSSPKFRGTLIGLKLSPENWIWEEDIFSAKVLCRWSTLVSQEETAASRAGLIFSVLTMSIRVLNTVIDLFCEQTRMFSTRTS